MARIVVTQSISLDGVVQGLGGPDEDTRGGFEHGGWGRPYADAKTMAKMGEGMARTTALLFGRRTYEDFAAFWPEQTDGNPFTGFLDGTPKHVASRTLAEPLPWRGSTLLKGEAVDAVAELKGRLDGDIAVLGSGELVRSLAAAHLVDEYVLSIHPLVLGSGRRLFPDRGPFAELRLVDAITTDTGVVIATYRN